MFFNSNDITWSANVILNTINNVNSFCTGLIKYFPLLILSRSGFLLIETKDLIEHSLPCCDY